MKLTDLDAALVHVTADGAIRRHDHPGANALWFDCPCGRHSNLIAFEPTIGGAAPSQHGRANGGGTWKRTGDTLDNLTLQPSINVNSNAPGGSCWHGFVTNGDVTS